MACQIHQAGRNFLALESGHPILSLGHLAKGPGLCSRKPRFLGSVVARSVTVHTVPMGSPCKCSSNSSAMSSVVSPRAPHMTPRFSRSRLASRSRQKELRFLADTEAKTGAQGHIVQGWQGQVSTGETCQRPCPATAFSFFLS